MFSAIALSLDFCLLLVAFLFLVWYVAMTLDIIVLGYNQLTSRRAAKQISAILKLYKRDSGVLYDLGSCRGELVLWLASRHVSLCACGIDASRFRTLYARVKSWVRGNRASFLRADFFEKNFSAANVVYAYLKQEDISKLENKLNEELLPGAIVITNTQHFLNWQPDKTFVTNQVNPDEEKIFVYVKS